MTAAQLKRATFLLEALEGIRYELDVPEDDRAHEVEQGKRGFSALSMLDPGEKFCLSMSEPPDGDGSVRMLATIDRELCILAMRLLEGAICRELAELGVTLD